VTSTENGIDDSSHVPSSFAACLLLLPEYLPSSHIMRLQIFVLIALLCVIASAVTVRRAAVHADRRKHLSGSPDEFSGHILPDPTHNRQRSEGAMIPLSFGKPGALRAGQVVWSREIPVDSTTQFTCTIFTPIDGVEVRFRLPGQRALVLGEALLPEEQIVKERSFGLSDEDLPSTTYVVSCSLYFLMYRRLRVNFSSRTLLLASGRLRLARLTRLPKFSWRTTSPTQSFC